MAITAQLVKELREKTGAGMMDCKKALVQTEGDMEKAIDFLREKGIAKAANKGDRIAAEGLTSIVVEGNQAVILEVNSETDFVVKTKASKHLLKNWLHSFLLTNLKALKLLLSKQWKMVQKLQIILMLQLLKSGKINSSPASKSLLKQITTHLVHTFTWVDVSAYYQFLKVQLTKMQLKAFQCISLQLTQNISLATKSMLAN